MDSKIKKTNKAFTLLEVLVYVVVFSIIVGGTASITISVYRNKTIVEDRINVNEDMRLLNKLIRDDVYLGSDISVTSASSFTISSNSSADIVYYLNQGRVYRQEGTSDPVVITSALTQVLNFEVEDLSSPAAAETMRIRMRLSNYDNGTLRPPIIQDVTTTFSVKFL